MTLSALAEKLNGELIGNDVVFTQVSTDTRALEAGDVYLALCGKRFDGNELVDSARESGAAAAIVSAPVQVDMPTLRVADTHVALGAIANLNRRRARAKLLGLTGSQGKTTVKEMIGAILTGAAPTLITEANLNNTIGVPLTLLRLTAEHVYAVIEMGADRAGEIAFSAHISEPDFALITNAGAAHLEGFGSLQGIVAAKGEIIDAVAAGGVVILNADDANVDQWISRAGNRKTVLFSSAESQSPAACFASGLLIGKRGQVSFTLNTSIGQARIQLRLLGRHNVSNGVAAAAAAIAAGATLPQVVDGLENLMPVKGRLYPLPGVKGSSLVDDTYNANPGSFAAAIDVLATFSARRVVVAGDMKELGDESESAHRQLGEYAAAAGVDALLAVGEMSGLAAAAFGAAGRHFADKADLVDACRRMADEDTVFLIKGSRGAHMESVVNELTLNGGV